MSTIIINEGALEPFYIYSGFNKYGILLVGYISGEPTIKSEADAKAFAESLLCLERVVVQTRFNRKNAGGVA